MRKITFLMALLMLLMSPSPVLAEDVFTDGFWEYTADGGSVTVTGYFGREENAVVPSVIAGRPVSVIAEGTFRNTSVKSVMIPDTVMEIREGAIPGNVTVSYYSAGAAYDDPVHPAQEDTKDDAAGPGSEEASSAPESVVSGQNPEEKTPVISETEDSLAEDDLSAEGPVLPEEKVPEKSSRPFRIWILAAAAAIAVCLVPLLIKKKRGN